MGKKSDKPYTGGWYDQRNKRRQEEYHSDPELRSKLNASSRDGYRERVGVDLPFDPRQNAGKSHKFGSYRSVRGGDADVEVLTFTKSELGEVLGRPTKQVQQWAADGRIPPTQFQAKKEGVERMPIDVYFEDEVEAIIQSIGEHLATLIYFRTDHVDAIRAVHDAVEEVRRDGN